VRGKDHRQNELAHREHRKPYKVASLKTPKNGRKKGRKSPRHVAGHGWGGEEKRGGLHPPAVKWLLKVEMRKNAEKPAGQSIPQNWGERAEEWKKVHGPEKVQLKGVSKYSG